MLSTMAQERFPNATIHLIALPLHNGSADHFKKCNMAMARVAKSTKRVHYINISSSTSYITNNGRQLTTESNRQLAKTIRGYLNIPSSGAQAIPFIARMGTTNKPPALLATPSPLQRPTTTQHRRTLLPTPPYSSNASQRNLRERKQSISQSEAMYNEQFPPLPHKLTRQANPTTQSNQLPTRSNTQTSMSKKRGKDIQTGADATTSIPTLPSRTPPRNANCDTQNHATTSIQHLPSRTPPQNTNCDTKNHEQMHTPWTLDPKHGTIAFPTMPQHFLPTPMMPPYFPPHPFFPFYPYGMAASSTRSNYVN